MDPAVLDLLRLLLPALLVGLVALAAFALARRQAAARAGNSKPAPSAVVAPLQVAAYERALLYLVRLHPDSLIRRADAAAKPTAVYAQELVQDILAEYEHNAVQQLYISLGAWRLVERARDAVLQGLAEEAEQAGAGAPAPELARRLLARNLGRADGPLQQAMLALRQDVAQLYLGAGEVEPDTEGE